MSDNVIQDFQQRRQLDTAIDEMVNTKTEIALVEAARDIQRTFPAALVLPALLRRLETQNSQLRGGLARLAVLLPREETASALRQYTANRHNPSQGRAAAAMILERFLDESVSPALVSDLHDSNDAAFQSLVEAVEEGKRNRHVLHEYVTQMQTYGDEIASLVMQSLDRLPAADRVDLLRLISQDDRPRVAADALKRLILLAESTVPLAGRALYTLQVALPPATVAPIERTLRKLQFRGLGYQPPTPEGWRALLAPADPSGHMMVWLVHMPDTHGRDGFLAGVLVHLLHGIVYSIFVDQVDPKHVPPPASIGQLTSVPMEAGAAVLEVPLDVGRWLVQQALAAHWDGRAQRRLAGEFKLYNDLFWQFAAPKAEPALAALLATAEADAARSISVDDAQKLTTELMAHPAMYAWTLPGLAMVEAALGDTKFKLEGARHEMVGLLLGLLDSPETRKELLPMLALGLRMQALWFHLAGEVRLAQHAQSLSVALLVLPVRQNPLLAKMLDSGINQIERRTARRSKRTRK